MNYLVKNQNLIKPKETNQKLKGEQKKEDTITISSEESYSVERQLSRYCPLNCSGVTNVNNSVTVKVCQS